MDGALSYGATAFSLIVGEKSEQIKKYVSDNYQAPCTYYLQKDFLGIATAIKLADDDLNDEPVLIILGDTIFTADLAPVINSKYSAIAVKEVEDPRRLGIAILDSEGFVTRLEEKPKDPESNLALVGVYYFQQGRLVAEAIRELLKRDIKTNGEYQITDAIQVMVESGKKIRTFPLTGWYDCGTVESFLESNQFLVSLKPSNREFKDSIILGDNYIPETVKLERSVIGPHVSLGENVTISNSIVSNSLIDNNTTISNMNIKDSIIGANVKLRGSSNCINVADQSILTNSP